MGAPLDIPLLGPFQVRLLLALISLYPRGYVSTAAEYVERRTGRRTTMPAVHAVVSRLLDAGLVRGVQHAARPVQGGRARVAYQITDLGRERLLTKLAELDVLRLDLPPSLRHEDR